MATAVIPPIQTNAEATRETPQTGIIPEAAASMQTNADVARETPQTETIPEAAPSTQTNAEAARETLQTETIPEATPSMQHIQPAAGQGVILKQYRDAAAPAPAPPMDAGRVITRQGANIRDAPTSSTVLRAVPRGTVLQVFARRDGWIRVGQDVPIGLGLL
jgi:hypothetical protein